MRMYDLIEKKKCGYELSKEEIQWMIQEYVEGNIPDYQMSAFLMSVYFRGMTDEELSALTNAMAHSGDMVDLSAIQGIKADKHSTGGVGDKTTLIIAPIVAACGVKIAKMSGRGLGHTGGTIDKLESIPGFRVAIPTEEFFDIVNKAGISVVGQSGNLAPADKLLYALRDVTATVDSIPLIAASIMSKKLAAGSDCILLDVKTGSGAFMKSIEDSITLAQKMVHIGASAGRKIAALITNMDIPLGNAIGNSLEVIEAVDVLNGNGPEDLTQVSCELAANMLYLADKGTLEECRSKVKEAISSKAALEKLKDMVKAQGGDVSVIEDTGKFERAEYFYDVIAQGSGVISHINAEEIGVASVALGAGRETKESTIDYHAGILLRKKTGDSVKAGDVLGTLYSSSFEMIETGEKLFRAAYTIDPEAKQEKAALIFARVTEEGIERL
ncbi:pyrimidine-nucleoside phosphorylase [[Clostridium] polysaccharolyticum]|uniref:Pyrimidine-nucleoside phosphorylase n=1 Tax=[Clostridium] polysaccharolyticum TaxID=29364 RepID=A0A1I0BSK8_9FIRM|nr:pyrimidine-nucleoside phosphorylase [[Clostridium] polysaccharolyticum]SET10054.1 pyrimidine-nucleoside phosphorylase [[Clostridium] polysaccharolyticum]